MYSFKKSTAVWTLSGRTVTNSLNVLTIYTLRIFYKVWAVSTKGCICCTRFTQVYCMGTYSMDSQVHFRSLKLLLRKDWSQLDTGWCLCTYCFYPHAKEIIINQLNFQLQQIAHLIVAHTWLESGIWDFTRQIICPPIEDSIPSMVIVIKLSMVDLS